MKRQPFAEASEGAIGLETLLAAALRLVHSGDVPLMTVLRAMTQRPAEILGLASGRLAVGAPADFILIDPDYPVGRRRGGHRLALAQHRLRGRPDAGRGDADLRCGPLRSSAMLQWPEGGK